jgi:hypothetical protein
MFTKHLPNWYTEPTFLGMHFEAWCAQHAKRCHDQIEIICDGVVKTP